MYSLSAAIFELTHLDHQKLTHLAAIAAVLGRSATQQPDPPCEKRVDGQRRARVTRPGWCPWIWSQ